MRNTRLGTWLAVGCMAWSCAAAGCSLDFDRFKLAQHTSDGGALTGVMDSDAAGAADAGRVADDAASGGSGCGKCKAGQVDDGRGCRAVLTCAALSCPAPSTCQARSTCDDAFCGCPAGLGWDVVEHTCRPCGKPLPACNASGQTAALLSTQPKDGAACICENAQGYFSAAASAEPVRCDADDDGWVNDLAQSPLESSDPVDRYNTKCDLRRVGRVSLENEAGARFTGADDYLVRFPGNSNWNIAAGLPLYESARNDSGSTADFERYGDKAQGRAPLPAELNGLTRACVSAKADYNDNGLPDYAEGATGVPVATRLVGNSQLASYYTAYAELSYFVELHDGWYELPSAQRSYGVYHIVEKPRRAKPMAESVPVVFPAASASYAASCKRHPDALYGKTSSSFAGGDFSRYGDAAGMTHHSQFKCVQVESKVTYTSQSDRSDATHPEAVYVDGSALWRRTSSGVEALPWTLNDCHLSSAPRAAHAGPTASTTNPALPVLGCTTLATSDAAVGSVRWAAAGFQPYTTAYVSESRRGDYHRGCIDQCLEEIDPAPVAGDCLGCVTDPSSGAGKRVSDLPIDGNDCTDDVCVDGHPQNPYTKLGMACGISGVCDGAGDCGACLPAQRGCDTASDVTLLCDGSGAWMSDVDCHGDGTYCSAGNCAPCAAPQRDCDDSAQTGCETNTDDDPANCGACGAMCSANHVDLPACASGSCNGACSSGFDDCNSNKLSDGCEQDTQNDASHCGGCNLACSTQNIAPHCSSGTCDGTCVPDTNGIARRDCNGDKRTDGCESMDDGTSPCFACNVDSDCTGPCSSLPGGAGASLIAICGDGSGSGAAAYCYCGWINVGPGGCSVASVPAPALPRPDLLVLWPVALALTAFWLRRRRRS